jgi:hypothetical protein
LSKKEDILVKLKENYKKLATDLESQKEVRKKIEEVVTEQTKQYNEMARSFNK